MAKDEVLTIENVAKQLGLHPKTVRKHITDGRLKAHKVGRQWRVRGSDLEVFLGGQSLSPSVENIQVLDVAKAVSQESGGRNRRIRVTSVVDIAVSGKEEAERIATFVFTSLNSPHDALDNPRCDYIFFGVENRARFVFWGSPGFMAEMLACLDRITES